MKVIATTSLAVWLIAFVAFAEPVREGVEKHITQVCLAYNGVEYVKARRTLSVELERGSHGKQTIVLFSIEFIDGGNFDYQFVSVLNNFEVPNGVRPVFFQKIGGKGIRYISSMTNNEDGVLLTGLAYGTNDPMSKPSVPCAFKLTSENGVISLKKLGPGDLKHQMPPAQR